MTDYSFLQNEKAIKLAEDLEKATAERVYLRNTFVKAMKEEVSDDAKNKTFNNYIEEDSKLYDSEWHYRNELFAILGIKVYIQPS